MTALVTGGTGFLGGALIRALRADGLPVRALVRGGHAHPGAAALAGLGAEIAEGDLGDSAAVHRAAEGVEHVYHCAALVSDWAPRADFVRANDVGTRHVVEACLTAGVSRLVHISTTDVYGYPDAPVDEDAPHRETGIPYGDTKIAAERHVFAAIRERALPAVVLRPASIYGPGSMPFVTEPAALLKARMLFRISGPPRPLGLAYVDNVVQVVRSAAVHPACRGRAFNVHDGLPTSFNEYIDRLAETLSLPKPRLRMSHGAARRLGSACEGVWGALRLSGRPPMTRLAADLIGTHQGFALDRLTRTLGPRSGVDLDEALVRIGRDMAQRARDGHR